VVLDGLGREIEGGTADEVIGITVVLTGSIGCACAVVLITGAEVITGISVEVTIEEVTGMSREGAVATGIEITGSELICVEVSGKIMSGRIVEVTGGEVVIITSITSTGESISGSTIGI
jgi:hypothetical protein